MNRSAIFNHFRLRAAFFALCTISLSIGAGYGQSLDVNDGANAVGIGLFTELHPDELLSAGGVSSTFSIAGAMDLGAYFSHTTRTVDDVRGSERSLGFIYNILPVKQQSGVPISLQLNFRYALSYVDRSLVKAEFDSERDAIGAAGPDFDDVRVDSSRRGFTLGAGLSRAVRLSDSIALRLGAEAEYRVARTVYSSVSNTAADNGDSERIELRAPATTRLYYGPRLELRLALPQNTVVSAGSALLFDDIGAIMVRPTLSAAFLRYQ